MSIPKRKPTKAKEWWMCLYTPLGECDEKIVAMSDNIKSPVFLMVYEKEDLDWLKGAAKDLSKQYKLKIKLVKFSNREEIEEFG